MVRSSGNGPSPANETLSATSRWWVRSALRRRTRLSARPFLYRQVLARELPRMDQIVRAKRPQRPPTGAVARRSRGAVAVDDGRATLDGVFALRRGPASPRVLPAAGEGSRQFARRDRRSKRPSAVRTLSPVAEPAAIPDRGAPGTGAPRPRARPGERLRQRGAAIGARAQVPPCGVRVGVAMGVPCNEVLSGSRKRSPPQAPPARVGAATRRSRGGYPGEAHPPGHVPCATALVRDPLLENGYDIRTIQELLGHRDLSAIIPAV